MRFIICLSLLFFPLLSYAEWSGYIGAEARLFANPPLFPEQREQSASIAAEPEYYKQWDSGNSLTFKTFARLDSADTERTHVDIRELVGLWLFDNFELRVGISKVFWGVAESQHLVDIINQNDQIEYIDGEDKLGQPMVYLSFPKDWGTLDIFVMPYFRERISPGVHGRLRSQFFIDNDNATYESSAEEYHVDFALRYNQSWGNWDIGLSYFRGTGREPSLQPSFTTQGIVLTPYYQQIEQYGLDLQWIYEGWLLKLEAIQRLDQLNRVFVDDDYLAVTTGFEYTISNIKNSGLDIGIIAEWLYDERNEFATNPFQDDLLIGARFALNDANSTEMLIGMIQDLATPARSITLEASRRIGNNWKLEANAVIFAQQDRRQLLYDARDDDMLQISLLYYF